MKRPIARLAVAIAALVTLCWPHFTISAIPDEFEAAGKLIQLHKADEAVPILEKFIASDVGGMWTMRSHLRLANAYSALDNRDKAIAHYKKALEFPAVPIDLVVHANSTIAEFHRKAGDYASAIAIYEPLIKTHGAQSRMAVWALIRYRLGLCYVATNNVDAAITEFEAVISDYRRADQTAVKASRDHLLDLYPKVGQSKKAIDLIVRALEQTLPMSSNGYVRQEQANLLTRLKKLVANETDIDINMFYKELFMKMVSAPEMAADVQAQIVDVHFANGDYARAGAEALILYQAGPATSAEKAVDHMARSLKAMDGSVARANQLLLFLKHGAAGEDGKTGTDDDVITPLAALNAATDRQYDALFDARINAESTDWEGRCVRARLYRYNQKPKEALNELKIALAICPMEQAPLQKVTDDIVDLFAQLSDNKTLGEAFVAFQKFGPAGPDKTVGNDDDLVDPTLQFVKN